MCAPTLSLWWLISLGAHQPPGPYFLAWHPCIATCYCEWSNFLYDFWWDGKTRLKWGYIGTHVCFKSLMLVLTSSSPPGFWHYFWFPVLPEERMSRVSAWPSLPPSCMSGSQRGCSASQAFSQLYHCWRGHHMTRTAAPKFCCRMDYEPNSTYHRDFYKSLSFIQRLQRNLGLWEIKVAIKPYLINSPVFCCCVLSSWFTAPQLCRHSFLWRQRNILSSVIMGLTFFLKSRSLGP